MDVRLVDYFLVVGYGDSLVPTDPGHSLDITKRQYKSNVVDRFPLEDYADTDFPPGLEMFCFPHGMTLTYEPGMPKLHYFGATIADGTRLYSCCLMFDELVPPEHVADLKRRIQEGKINAEKEAEEAKKTEEEKKAEAEQKATETTAIAEEPTNTETEPIEEERDEKVPEEGTDQAEKAEAESKGAEKTEPTEAENTDATEAETAEAENSDATDADKTEGEKTETPLTEEQTDIPTENEQNKPVVQVEEKKLYASKCICILSQHSFLEEYRVVLTEIFRLSTMPEALPIERTISNFMLEVPFPPEGKRKVKYTINDKTITFARSPANNPLHYSHFNYGLLFQCLDTNNVETLIEALLLEKRILILSTQLSALTVITECITRLIYPFEWHYSYIPLLPKQLADFLAAPYPFLIGTHPSFIEGVIGEDVLCEVVVVDLDNNTVKLAPLETRLPAKERKKLLKALIPLEKIYRSSTQANLMQNLDSAFQCAPPPDESESRQEKLTEDQIREQEANLRQAFFRVFVSLFKNYRQYLIFPTPEDPYPAESFDIKSFIKTMPRDSHAFLKAFIPSQAFQSFAEQRFFEDKNQPDKKILFFDESIIAKKNRSAFVKKKPTPFLDQKDYDFNDSQRKPYEVPMPDWTGIDLKANKRYQYESFPKLNPELFITKPRDPRPLGDLQSDKSSGSTGDSSPDQIIFCIWFTIFAALVKEKGNAKDLEKGLDIMMYMEQRQLVPGAQIFGALLNACNSNEGGPNDWIDIKIATRLVDEMCKFGFSPDSGLANQLLRTFESIDNKVLGYKMLEKLAKAKLEKNAQVKRRARPRAPDASAFERYVALFDFNFPELTFALEECAECKKPIADSAIRSQWKLDDPNQYGIMCPHCHEQVVPRFQVGPRDEVIDPAQRSHEHSMMYLSPAVLRKNIFELLEQEQANYFTTSHFHEHNKDTYWNLAWHLTNHQLPTDFCILRKDNTKKEDEQSHIYSPSARVVSRRVAPGSARINRSKGKTKVSKPPSIRKMKKLN